MRLTLPLLLLASAAIAQDEGARSVRGDLDGDGADEIFTLADNGQGGADLVIEDDGALIVAEGFAWRGDLDYQQPSLALSETDTLLVQSLNEAVGPPWHMSVSVYHDGEEWRVGGLVYDWYDRIDPEKGAVCVFNLVTGEGTVTSMSGEARALAPTSGPVPIADWQQGLTALPVECLMGAP